MKTMFPTQNKAGKGKFQKPNILRKQTKPSTKANIAVKSGKPVFGTTHVSESELRLDNNTKVERTESEASELSIDNNELKQNWCLSFIDDEQEIFIEDLDGSHLGCLRMAERPAASTAIAVPTAAVVSPHSTAVESATPTQHFAVEYISGNIFKCDKLGCNKQFKSEQNFVKHIQTHKPSSCTKLKPTTVECPVKKDIEGVENRCRKIFLSKKALMEHLNSDHTPEDAEFVCETCSRRFFWAVGLRAHARCHAAAAALACAWPGCGRAFRHPCRLREHMRAHTGDKPYPCQYPNCGWSFRTASKLERHARRHTGERRHACACGRAFRRRDHLRDHAARHARRDGCSGTFADGEGIMLHVQNVHKDALCDSVVVACPEIQDSFSSGTSADALSDERIEESVQEEETKVGIRIEGGEEGAGREGGAARTHCPWPLPRTHTQRAGLDEDVQVETSESSESNIYTIRSDLFLHGNVLNNEDSEHMGGEAPLLVVQPPDTDLLLDTHPTIDLMQEELMYTDSAVDESSFRVFLLSGEELGQLG